MLGGLYSKFFDWNKSNFYISCFFHKNGGNKVMHTINVNHNSKELLEHFDSIANYEKDAKKKSFFKFLKNTKLPKPKGLTSESNQ